jgi:hypothetical protein
MECVYLNVLERLAEGGWQSHYAAEGTGVDQYLVPSKIFRVIGMAGNDPSHVAQPCPRLWSSFDGENPPHKGAQLAGNAG